MASYIPRAFREDVDAMRATFLGEHLLPRLTATEPAPKPKPTAGPPEAAEELAVVDNGGKNGEAVDVPVRGGLTGAPPGDPPAGEAEEGAAPSPLRCERSPRRVRAVVDGIPLVDSARARLVWHDGAPPSYWFPHDDVRGDMLSKDARREDDLLGTVRSWSLQTNDREVENAVFAYPPNAAPDGLEGFATIRWDAADAWFEEDERVFVHPRDPYTRVDTRESSRHVGVRAAGELLANSRRPVLLFETGQPVRYYLPLMDVRTALLVPSETTTRCPYKGVARYFSLRLGDRLVKDACWTYESPLAEAERVAGRLCFDDERVDVTVDGATRDSQQLVFHGS